MAGKRIGLVIGNNYPNSDEKLKFAVADAKKMKEILENKDICGFDEVTYLEDGTSEDASTAVEKILKKADNDLVFFYYSGHGKKDFENNLCLLFKDTEEDSLLTTSLTFDFINKCIRYPSRKSVVIVLDCCYSGVAGLRGGDADVAEDLKKFSNSGTVILTSTGSTGSPTAREDEKLGHGIFTYYLIEGIEKGHADNDGDGLIFIDELYDYAYEKTKGNCSQSPKMVGEIEGTIPIGKNPLKIREREYELKKKRLLDEFGVQFPSDILGECQAILRKHYKNHSLLEKDDKIILGYIESLLCGDLSSEKRDDIIQNCIEAVQYLKKTSANSSPSQEARLKQEMEILRKQKEEEEKAKVSWQTVQNPAEHKVPPKRQGGSGKGIFVFSLVFGALLICAAMFTVLINNPYGNQKPQPISDNYTNTIGMEFAKIPAGEFEMGSPLGEEGRSDDEGPVHKVTLAKSYFLGKYEVTQKQWKSVMGDNPSHFNGDDLPVDDVSWNDVQIFIKKLNQIEGTDIYRLPSEAEWEYACRAGTSTRYFFGDNQSKLGDYAWYSDNSGNKTHSIGQKKPNPWGLYDMNGNVWEWCQDNYYGNYNSALSDGSAWEGGSSLIRIRRGSGWDGSAGRSRSANRGRHAPDYSLVNLGFRVLMIL